MLTLYSLGPDRIVWFSSFWVTIQFYELHSNSGGYINMMHWSCIHNFQLCRHAFQPRPTQSVGYYLHSMLSALADKLGCWLYSNLLYGLNQLWKLSVVLYTAFTYKLASTSIYPIFLISFRVGCQTDSKPNSRPCWPWSTRGQVPQTWFRSSPF